MVTYPSKGVIQEHRNRNLFLVAVGANLNEELGCLIKS